MKPFILLTGPLWCVFVAHASLAAEPAAATDLSPRYKLLELDQPERDLDRSAEKINILFDTETGRSWVLSYTLKPGSSESGYVWVEVPTAALPPPAAAVPPAVVAEPLAALPAPPIGRRGAR